MKKFLIAAAFWVGLAGTASADWSSDAGIHSDPVPNPSVQKKTTVKSSFKVGGAQPGCTQFGGYPWVQGGCFNAADVNAAFNGNWSAVPPQNNLGQGAQQGKYWVDTSSGPTSPTLRQCMVSPSCSSSYVSSEWITWGIYNVTQKTFTFTANIFTGYFPATRTIFSGTTDTVLPTDVVINWFSATGSAKTETLIGCTGSNNGQSYTFKDEKGDAFTNHITLTAPVGSSIDGLTTYVMNVNNEAIILQCDGSRASWNVQ